MYSHYCRAGGLWLCFLTMLFNALFQACAVGTNVWLTQWSAENEQAHTENRTLPAERRDIYLAVYGIFGFGQGIAPYCSLSFFKNKFSNSFKFLIVLIVTYTLFGAAITLFISDVAPRLGAWFAAKVMHDVMLHGIVRAPLAFHDVTPQGRILSRFSKDVDVMDNLLPQQIADTLWCMFEV